MITPEDREYRKPVPQYLTRQTVPRVTAYISSIADEGNFKVSFKPVSQRTLDQNAKLQAMCTDIAKQLVLTETGYCHMNYLTNNEFRQFSHNDWRHILMAGFTKAEIVPGIEPGQAVCLYPSTTELSLSRGADFIEYISAFGAEHGVEWAE